MLILGPLKVNKLIHVMFFACYLSHTPPLSEPTKQRGMFLAINDCAYAPLLSQENNKHVLNTLVG